MAAKGDDAGMILHDAVWTRQLAEELRRRGAAVGRILAEAGLTDRALNAEDARVPFTRSAAFFELAAAGVNDARLGLHFAQTRDARDGGLLAYVGLSSATVGDAIKNISRYRKVANDATEMDIGALDEKGVVDWWFQGSQAQPIRQFREFSAANFWRSIRQAAGRELRPVSLCMTHPRNSHIAEFERFFGCEVTFGAPVNRLVMKREDLSAPLLTSDDRLLTVLRAYCRDVLAARARTQPTLIEQVEREIANRLAKGEATLENVAQALAMSSRSLSRRLAEQGGGFNDILRDLRKALALSYLENSDLSLTEIAFLLGYGEISTFSATFRRWTGTTPGAARARVSGRAG